MKKLLVLTMVLSSFVSYGQLKQPKYDGEYLYSTLENGVGIERTIKFSLDKDRYEKVKSSELFSLWKKITWDNPKNKEYIDNHKGWDEVIMYLNGQITMSKIYLKMKLKNGSSLDFIDDSKGIIYFSDNNGIRISYPMKAQNGYGSYIVGSSIYSIDIKNGVEKTDCYIYNN
jgi:hypothetical protein